MKVMSGAAAALAMLAVAWLAVASLAGSALAEDDDDKQTEIDCGKTDFAFKGADFEVRCTEFKDHQIHQTDGSAQVQVNVMFANSTQAPDWLIAVDSRILGSLAIRRVGLEDDIATYFKTLAIKDWKRVDDVQDFETAEFVSIGDGEVRDCIAFQRFVSRRYNGFSRWVVGVSCSSDGKEMAYKTLAGFSGPGD